MNFFHKKTRLRPVFEAITDIFRNFVTLKSTIFTIIYNRKRNSMIRNIPLITKNLLIINLIAFLAMLGLKGWGIDLNDVLGLHFFLAGNFHVYQLFTYMFMHGGWEHILFNMFALWMFGSAVEYRWGAKRFLFFYIFCGVGAGLLQEMAQLGRFYMMAYDQIPQFSLSDTMALAYNSRDYLNLLTTVGRSPTSAFSSSPFLSPSRASGLW